MDLGAENKLEQKQENTDGLGKGPDPAKTVGAASVKDDSMEKIFHIKLDATKDINEQKASAGSQIIDQLEKYDGRGLIVVSAEFAALEHRQGPEGDLGKAEQEAKINRLKDHINSEIHKRIDAVRIIMVGDVKILHPEQRLANETKPVLQQEGNEQKNVAANTTESIKNDDKKIVQVKKGMKR